jgi:carbamoyl-phosphate synthase small subunit
VTSAFVPAILALADGSLFRGRAIGATDATRGGVGEVVFNTAMTGYQEILTDPSYAGQIVTLTYPHIGNTGVNPEDVESSRIYAAALVIRDLPRLVSNWRSTQDLSSYLRAAGVVGICDIDTRKLTRMLRDNGAQNGCVLAGGSLSLFAGCPLLDAAVSRGGALLAGGGLSLKSGSPADQTAPRGTTVARLGFCGSTRTTTRF